MDTTTTYVAPRTCTAIDEGEASRDAKVRAMPLSGYANAATYVLIAEPGAGKTTAFETEAASQGVRMSQSGTFGPSTTGRSGTGQHSFWMGSTSRAPEQRMAGRRSTTSGIS